LKAFEAHPTKAKHGQELGAMGSWQLTVTQRGMNSSNFQLTLGFFGSFQSEDARKRNNILGQQKRIWVARMCCNSLETQVKDMCFGCVQQC